MAMPTEKTCYDGGEHDLTTLPNGFTWCIKCGSGWYNDTMEAPTCHADYADRENEDAEGQGDSEI